MSATSASIERVRIETQPGYDVLIGRGLLSRLGELLKEVHPLCKVALISDSTVSQLYLSTARESLEAAGFSTRAFVFPAGESSKTLSTYGEILSFLARERFSRSDLVLALGGGVTGDMSGFAAATYQRGMAWVQAPTTLLAAVDASVGGKTAVDLPEGKNLVGAFHQPSLVVCDCDCLATLEQAQIQDGLAEMLKHGCIADVGLFQRLTEHFDVNAADAETLIRRNIEIKSQFVLADEKDQGLRQILNFGHTIGHAIEKCSHFQLSHGQAVAIGMLAEARAAYRMELSRLNPDALAQALAQQALPSRCNYSADEIWLAATSDKKRSGGSINLVVLPELGKAELRSLNMEELRKFIQLA